MTVRHFSVLVPMLLAVGCTRSAGEPITIGHLAPFSGANKARGEHARHGLQLSLQDALPELAKELGRKVVILHVDHADSAATLQAEAVRLMTVNKAKVLIADCSPALGEQLARTVQAQEVPAVLTGDLSPPRSGVVTLGLEGSVRGTALARWASQKQKVKSAVVLTPRQGEQVPGLITSFLRQWQSVPGNTAHEWNWDGDTGLAEVVSRIAKAKPGAVLVGAGVEEFRRVRQALDTAAVKVPLLFGGVDTDPDVFRDGPAGSSLYFATAFATDGLTESGREVARRYENMFQERLGLDAAQGYDSAQLVFEALRRSRASKNLTIAQTLANIETFEALTGTLKIVQGRAHRPAFLVELRDGAVRFLETVPATPE